jgi:hypothetical protein
VQSHVILIDCTCGARNLVDESVKQTIGVVTAGRKFIPCVKNLNLCQGRRWDVQFSSREHLLRISGLAECRRGGTGTRAEEPRRLRCGTCVPTAPISAENRVSRLPCPSWARPAAHFITPLALASCLVTGQLIHPVPWAPRAGRGRSWRQADALDRRLALPQLAVRSTAVRCFWRRSIQSTAR